MGEDAVAPVKERSILKGVLVTVGLIVERIAGRLIETAKREHAEALIAEGAFHLRAAVERADVGRVKDVVWDGRDRRRRRARTGVCVDIVCALSEERPVLDELAAELLRRDRLLVDFDVREIRRDRADETHRRRDRITQVQSDVANLHRQKMAVGLLEEVAILSDARQAEDVDAALRLAAGAGDRDAGTRRPPARVRERRPISRRRVLHEPVVCPHAVLAFGGKLPDELDAPGLVLAAAHLQHVERDDEHGAPAVGADGCRRFPAGAIANVFQGLLVAHAARRRFEVVRLGARAARVDADPDEIVDPESHVVGGLGGDDRAAGSGWL